MIVFSIVCCLFIFPNLYVGDNNNIDELEKLNLDKLSRQLLSELQNMRTKYAELQAKTEKNFSQLSSELETLRKQYDALRAEDKHHQTTVPKDKIKYGITNGSQLLNSKSKRGIYAGNAIGFSAKLSTSLTNLGRDQTIKFDLVTTNIGNSYNPTTGIFTCTYAGMYVFFSNVLAYPEKRVGTEIVHNGKSVVNIYSANHGFYGNGCNMVVLQVNEGDTVWTRVDGDYHASGVEIDFTWTTFSGFLVT